MEKRRKGKRRAARGEEERAGKAYPMHIQCISHPLVPPDTKDASNHRRQAINQRRQVNNQRRQASQNQLHPDIL